MAIGDYMTDLATQMSSASAIVPKHSTNPKAGQSLDMDGFLQLMVAMLQNQSIDNTADTSEMLNQMVQMTVVQAITDISTLVSDSTSLTYAASLVGKEVTIGQYDVNNQLQETVGKVTGTGTLNGRQVIFIGDKCYNLTDIMAIGRVPDKIKDPNADDAETEDETSGGTEPTDKAPGTEAPGEKKRTGTVVQRTVADIPADWLSEDTPVNAPKEVG